MASRKAYLRLAKGSILVFLIGICLGWTALYSTRQARESFEILPRMVDPSIVDPGLANIPFEDDDVGRAGGNVIPVPNWTPAPAIQRFTIPATAVRRDLPTIFMAKS